MNQTSRKHHYVPEGYLIGFTRDKSSDDFLWIFDRKLKKTWHAKSQNVAFERDLYFINDPTFGADVFEKAFASFESKALPVIREICSTHTLPEEADMLTLMQFVAFMYARVPQTKETFEKPIVELSKMIMNMTLQSEERWESVVKQMKENGAEHLDKVSYEEMKKFSAEGNYEIRLTQEEYLRNIIDTVNIITPMLLRRAWAIFISEGEDTFICSDMPTALVSLDTEAYYSAGFGVPNTVVTFPLNSRAVLYGTFEGSPAVVPAGRKIVAGINQLTALYASQIYAGDERAPVANNDGEVVSFNELYGDVNNTSP